MGKKKSVVLMILITIVTVALCALTIFPAFDIPFLVNGLPKSWNPVVMQYDFGKDFGGSYYTYYYPEGVITEEAYDSLSTSDREEYVQHGGLYLSTELAYGIFDTDDEDLTGADVTDEFKQNFASTVEVVTDRFSAMAYADYAVSVVDDYALRVEIPASESNYQNVLTSFAKTGALVVQKGGSNVEGFEDELSAYVKSFTHGVTGDFAYVQVNFTNAGKKVLNDVKGDLSSVSGSAEGATTLTFAVGGETILTVYADHISANNDIKVPVAYAEESSLAQAASVLLTSAIAGEQPIAFESVSADSVVQLKAVENVVLMTYIAIAIVLLACIVLPIVKYGKYGVTCAYSTLGYLIISGICFAFISPTVFEVSFGTVLVFLVGLVLVNLMNVRLYGAIKSEFDLGKTVESSVKNGLKKVTIEMVDVYAVILLGAIALLIGTAGLHTFALQALICVLAGAFCNLLWHRLINLLMLSTSKNKFKYFRFVREDDDDE